MAQLIKDFVVQLAAIPVVAAQVGTNIFPIYAKNSPDTFIVYTPRGGTREVWFKDSFGKAVYNIQIDIYSKSFSANQELYDGIYSVFNGYSGQLNLNTKVSKTEVSNHSELFSDKDGDYYRTIFDISITY